MKRITKGLLCLCLAIVFCCLTPLGSLAVQGGEAQTQEGGVIAEGACRSALLMDAKTGQVLFEQNADEALPPASVTKIMTLLLVMEAIDAGRLALGDTVTASAHAASMGGSQVYLKEGEAMTVEEMLKCVIIASANDCAVALAEHVAGNEAAFVRQMNVRAAELGMKNTNFENTNGLDDTATHHVTSARDIAIMSRALIAHPTILKYSGIWMDTVRDGTFGLTNTNRLVRFYRGCTGLKTGSTARAGFCISATAERDDVSLIAVVMAAPTRDIRNQTVASLLDYGFANFDTYEAEGGELTHPVKGGVADICKLTYQPFALSVKKGDVTRVTQKIELDEALAAPLSQGDAVGRVVYLFDGREIGTVPIVAAQSVEKIGFFTLFCRILSKMLLL